MEKIQDHTKIAKEIWLLFDEVMVENRSACSTLKLRKEPNGGPHPSLDEKKLLHD